MSKKILLVDDEELVVKSIEKLMKKSGYEVVVCRSGEEALQKSGQGEYDLIISDIRMPIMNGVEALKKIRVVNLKLGKKSPKEILMTGFAEDAVNKEAESLGVSEYIYKPFDLRDFMDAVKRSLDN